MRRKGENLRVGLERHPQQPQERRQDQHRQPDRQRVDDGAVRLHSAAPHPVIRTRNQLSARVATTNTTVIALENPR